MTRSPDDGIPSWDKTVFLDEHIFEIDYVPKAFHHREHQMERLKYALQPAVRGSRPLNVVVQGPPGSGKTMAIRKHFDKLRLESGVRTVCVDCLVDSTRFAIFSRVFESVFEYEPPSSGISFKKLFRVLTERLVDDDVTLIVALDNLDYLFYKNEVSDTLFSLLVAHEIQPGVRIGVVAISSDPSREIITSVDGRVQSVFRPEVVDFPMYEQAEIEDILGERVERGFKKGVLPESRLEYVAKLTSYSGDLMVGIDLLRWAGLNAEKRGGHEVSVEDIDDAFDDAKTVRLARNIRALSDSEVALVEVLIEHSGEQAGDIYDVSNEKTGLSYRRYSDIVNKLDRLDIVDATYTTAEVRGRTRSLSLAWPTRAIKTHLE